MTFDSIAASPSHAANAAFVDRPGDFISPSGYDYNDIMGVRGNPHVTQAFIDKVEAISARIGTKPEYLMAVMSFESGQSFRPDVKNPLSGATGLIQFIVPTAQGLGTSTYALSQMTAIEQLDYVEKYFGTYKGERLGTLEGLYTTVLAGRPITDPNATLFDTGDGLAYTQNAGLDFNNDGRITSGEATSRVRQQAATDLPPPGGNVANPGPAPGPNPTPTPTPTPAPGGNTYTVQSGDSLWAIANANNTDWQTLAQLNGLRDANTIHPGQVLQLPGGAQADPGSYTVRNGDTLSGIASRLGTNWQTLSRLNGLGDPNMIYPGQVLRTPGGGDASPPATGTHTVQSGENLSTIAAANNTDWQTLARLNGLGDPNMIFPGQVLRTPGGGAAPAPAPTPAPVPETGTHTVRAGETLSGIAGQFNTSWQALAQLNGLANPNLIHVGQTLTVPGGGDVAPMPNPVPGPGGASTDRSSFYLQQPDGWSCGPASLTMALAAWGVRPNNMTTRNEAVGLIGQSWGHGVPGDASLIAAGARKAGLQASFNPSGSAASVRSALESGQTVILNGGLPGGGGHFIYVAGLDGNGNFIVGDPARPGITTMTAGQLETFSYANPGQHPNGFAAIWK
ncbi:LysM peptidoglycan-binding domain-containing protein [Luteimonas sp. MJ246]|uniref:LysM peptidoglycan-binding domain-containing protein n=1 Tax=Luteimonas sp. MJ174 TaxID=3129237 RepID=UPI0031BB9179